MQHKTKLLKEFAPTAVLRVALNHGNRVLVGRDDQGSPVGISVDLANALATHLGVDHTFVEYDRAVDVSSSASDGAWDVCFLAVDPERSETIAFAEPYVRIEGCYLAGAHCEAKNAEELVEGAAKVGTVKGTAYTLRLQRMPGAENLVVYDDIFAALDALDRRDVEGIAGIRQAMADEAKSRPGSSVLLPPFMEIRQAMAVPQGRPAASEALQVFLTDAARSGRVADILEAHGIERTCAILPD